MCHISTFTAISKSVRSLAKHQGLEGTGRAQSLGPTHLESSVTGHLPRSFLLISLELCLSSTAAIKGKKEQTLPWRERMGLDAMVRSVFPKSLPV